MPPKLATEGTSQNRDTAHASPPTALPAPRPVARAGPAVSVAPAASGPRRSLLFLALSVLIAVVALCGFWPSYLGPLAGGRLQTEPILTCTPP